MPISRRRFLGDAARVAGGLALAPGFLAGCGDDREARVAQLRKSILNEPASSSPIDTIVVVMMENRSVDHYFGWLAQDGAYLEAGRSRYGEDFRFEARNDLSYVDPATGEEVATYHLPSRMGELDAWRGCGHPDPGHGPVQGRAQRDGGFLAEGSGNDAFALGYYLEEDLPFYGPLARSFTICDRYHCSLLSATYPNRTYLHSAQSGGMQDFGIDDVVATLGFQWPTIWDRLRAKGVSGAYYFTDLPVIGFWGPRLLDYARPLPAFFADAAAGTLPHVVYLDPGFMSGLRTDDHPHGDMRVAQRFLSMVFGALQRSPQWSRTAFIVTYDEWGGFFDHVPPPILPDDHASTVDLENLGQAGFRVPTLIASPYARPGFVDHTLYDHASVLRFIEWRFLGAPASGPDGNGWWLTTRDRFAENIGASLASSPAADAILDPVPALPLGSLPCDGQIFQDVPGVQDVEDQLKLTLVEALERGVLEELGYDVDVGASLGFVRQLLGV